MNIDESKQTASSSEIEDNIDDSLNSSEPDSDVDDTPKSLPVITKKNKVIKGKGRQLRIKS